MGHQNYITRDPGLGTRDPNVGAGRSNVQWGSGLPECGPSNETIPSDSYHTEHSTRLTALAFIEPERPNTSRPLAYHADQHTASRCFRRNQVSNTRRRAYRASTAPRAESQLAFPRVTSQPPPGSRTPRS
jgi:hypothetical protein